MDLHTNKVFICKNVHIDEHTFPFSTKPVLQTSTRARSQPCAVSHLRAPMVSPVVYPMVNPSTSPVENARVSRLAAARHIVRTHGMVTMSIIGLGV